PILRNSAQQVLEKLSSELDQKLAPKIDEAHRAASGLTEAGEQATRLQNALREQVQQANDQAAQIQVTARDQVQRESQQAVQESLEKLRQESAKIPDEFEPSVRATLSKV